MKLRRNIKNWHGTFLPDIKSEIEREREQHFIIAVKHFKIVPDLHACRMNNTPEAKLSPNLIQTFEGPVEMV